ncbi:condensation domain-containing protein, partial [Virgibacillus salarius]
MHMVLLSAYYLLLSKYSGQEDIVIGTPVAGRSHADLQSIIGMFVNTLALRNRVDGNKRYVDFLKAVKENVLLAYENQSYQFEELIERLHINRDASRNPLFDVMFNMNPVDDTIVFPLEDDFQLKQVQHESNIAKFDVTLHVTEYTNTIQGSLEYSTALFTSETMERMARHYLEIVKGICQQREAKLAELDMMTEEEKQQIIMQFNDTKTDYPREKTMAELFEEQVAKKPNELAVGFENQCMTYQELNEKANQLARVLRQKGVQAETVVGLMTDNTIEMIIG